MASADVKAELVECPVCLNIYSDPVTLKCGHNFCRVLETQMGAGVYSCPECREAFQVRPTLRRNVTLHNIVANFRPPRPGQVKSGIFCTQCVDSLVPAVKSCLHCEVYLCDRHLKVHKTSPEHVFSDPGTSMESRKCPIHRKILEYFCSDDVACICSSCCLVGQHKGHKVEPLNEAFEKQKKRMKVHLQKLMRDREKTEKRIQSLRECRRKAEEKVALETAIVTTLFGDIRRQLEELQKQILEELSRQAGCGMFSNLIRQVEIKKDELSRKIDQVEELCNMTDPLNFLQESDISDLCDTKEEGNEDIGGLTKKFQDGRELDVASLPHIFHRGLSDITRTINRKVYISAPADVLLDVNTGHNNLHISDDRKTASWSAVDQNRLETPQRFQRLAQVLSCQSFSSGRHYWEVYVAGSDMWRVGVCYPSIDRGVWCQSGIGDNNKSWCLEKYKNQYLVRHDSRVSRLAAGTSSYRVRIDLDYEAGHISFYELGDLIRHLHTFPAKFTEPLHAALGVYGGCVNIS